MPNIRPVSDLRNKFSEISNAVHETGEPIYLTKNGYGDMIVMSIEAYEKERYEQEVYLKLKEAEIEATVTSERYSHNDVINTMRSFINKGITDAV